MRTLASILVLTFTLLSGLVFTTQGGAHAFVPVVAAVVAPTVARTVVVPIAKVACQTACRAGLGAAAAGAWGAAEAACMFAFGDCGLPFGQNPDVPPNSDQPASPGQYLAPSLSNLCISTSPTCKTHNPSFPDDRVGFSVQASPVQSHQPRGYGYNSVGSRIADLTNNFATSGGFWNFPSGLPEGVVGIWLGNHPDATVQLATGPCNAVVIWGTVPGCGALPETVPDPDRQGQGFRKCLDSSGVVTTLAGPVVTYRESAPARTATLPACPAGTTPVGGGVAVGSPWTPGEPVPAGTGTGTPLVPEWSPPTPEQLPHMPKPGESTAPRRTLPDTPAQPLPEPGPDGQPSPTPQPLPDPFLPEPTPEQPTPVPEGYCMWGGYAVAPEDCGSAPAPGPAPTPPAETTPTDPATDGTDCLGTVITLTNPASWVYGPVVCALQFVFVPGPATTDKLAALQVDLGSRVPLSWFGDVGGWIGTVLGSGSGGCFVYDVNLASLGRFHVINSCADEAVPNAIRPLRPLLVVAVYAAFLGPLAWWAWRSYAPLSRPQG